MRSSGGGSTAGKAQGCKTLAACQELLAGKFAFQQAPDVNGQLLDPRRLPQPVADPARPAPGAPARRQVTAVEVARFLPDQGAVHSEPHGWAVVGDPANFWVDITGPVTADGTLFGQDAQVRFTPQQYVWSYGDGGTRTSTTPGASWAALGRHELTATATSHVYTARGSAAVSVQVVYAALYRVGGGDWLPVQGLVFDTTPAAPLVVAKEGTVLTPTG